LDLVAGSGPDLGERRRDPHEEMASVYGERISDERLRAVSDTVQKRLFGGGEE
jgi:hypothetical protein